ncbi:MAG: ABC transporter permease [Defluviitaleaceae bacterium]|nr:ABC transporter permease [Defluviitaleaceae bacterium]
MRTNFANTGLLTRFMLRRERITSLLWILILGGTIVLLVPGVFYALPVGEREPIIDVLTMPAMVSMVGPGFAAYHSTFGALYTNFMMLFSALTAALMNIFLVIRLSRADEEKGRYEVLRSLPVGRLSNLAAAMLTALVVNIGLALFTGLGMYAFGTSLYDTGMCFNGSMLWGATLGVTGLVFAAFTALFAQLTASSRTAMGYAFMALGIFFLLRAPGDMDPNMEILALISPMGLLLRTQAYIANYWWPIFIMLGTAVLLTLVAFKLTSIRDIDQGIIPAKPGRAHGSFLTKSAGGFAFKLSRTAIIVWIISLFILGASYGAVLGTLDEFIASNEMYQQLILGPFEIEIPPITDDFPLEAAVLYLRDAVAVFGFTLPQLFSAMINMIMGIFAIVPATLFVLKARAEETDTRAELVLAASVGRRKYLGAFAIIAFVMAVLVQLSSSIGMFAFGAAAMESTAEFPLTFALQVGLNYVPAIWVKVGVAVLLVGLLPKATSLIWAYFAYTFVALFLGQGFGIFPDWALWLSPYGFVQQLPLAPGESFNWIVPVVLTVVAAALTAIGLWKYGRRDVNAIVDDNRLKPARVKRVRSKE